MSDTKKQDAEVKARKPGWRFGRFLLKIVLLAWIGIVIVAIGGAVVAYVVYDYVTQDGIEGPEVVVEIPSGASGEEIGRILKGVGLVEHEALFNLAMRLDTVQKPLQSGRYELHRGLSPLQLLHRIQDGPQQPLEIDQFKLTVPEGLTIRQMAELFDDPAAFIEAASDPALIERVGVEADTLEGFLMPNTYFFDEQPDPREAVERMLTQFERDYARLLSEVPRADEFDKLMIVTVASLIEEESKLDNERPLVAAVIYYRLDDKMLLGMDSTLQFALGKYGQRMLDADKEVDSPYNTYKHRGLPPGPISNPGVASLRAAMQPADEDYLYFVSNADGSTHTFSKTYQEHERAVARYRREIAEQRRAEEQRQREAGTQQ